MTPKHSSTSSEVLELKASPFQQLISVVVVLFLIWFFDHRWLSTWFYSPGRFEPLSLLLIALISGAFAWWLWGGAKRMWLETGLYLRTDEDGVTVHTRYKKVRLRWEEISSCTEEKKSTRRTKGEWITLRDKDGQVLAEWNRDWTNFNSKQQKRAYAIEKRIQERLEFAGQEKAEEPTYAQLWDQLHPITDAGTVVEVKAGNALLGWLCQLLTLPCALFFWNSPKGGYLIASVFLLFSALGFYLVLSEARLKASTTHIESSSLLGRRRMNWSDVKRVELNGQGQYLTFVGTTKVLKVTGPLLWRGHAQEFLLFICAQCETLDIPFDDRAPLRWSSKP